MKKTNARHQSASRTINRFNPDNEQTALNEAGPLWGRGTVRQKRMECGKGTEMTGELTKRSFEVPALLERHNAFEQEVCRTVFQDKYSSSVKTYHVIDHLISRGEELELMDVPSYLAAIEALKRFSSYHAGLIGGLSASDGSSTRSSMSDPASSNWSMPSWTTRASTMSSIRSSSAGRAL